MMKLMIAILQVDDRPVIETLVAHGHRVTRVASTGGFLRRGNVTLLIGVEEQEVESVLSLLREMCPPLESGRHCATVFVVNTPHFEQM